jgi:hypothetical protein
MADALPVFPGVTILRRVAATHRATTETRAQMNPSVSELDALLAHVAGRLCRDQPDEVLTRLVSVRDSPPTPKIAVRDRSRAAM